MKKESNLKIKINKFSYINDTGSIVQNLDVSFSNGDIVWLRGKVGCGKTTLLKIFAGIIPNFEAGFFEGEILFNGKKISEKNYKNITFCFQHSDSQFLFDTVERQFYKEKDEIETYASLKGFQQYLKKSVMDLSRGERKFITLLSTISKKRKLYIFDEPLDLLDNEKKEDILSEIKKLSKDSIVLISSHDKDISKIANKELTFEPERGWILDSSRILREVKEAKIYEEIPYKESNKELFISKEIEYKYKGNSIGVRIPPLSIKENEIIGVVGQNGTGKTTLLKLISNNSSYGREILFNNIKSFAFLSQSVNRQLFCNTVYEELFLGLKRISEEGKNYGDYLLEILELKGLEDLHPIFLSGGQKQKLVFASLLMNKPDLILLDEIFTNLDEKSINSIIFLLKEYREKNNLSIILTDQEKKYLSGICDKIIPMPFK